MRRLRFCSALILLSLLAACGSDGSGLVLIYPDTSARDDAGQISLYVLRPTTDGDLCSQLLAADNPRSPNDPTLVQDDRLENVPAADFADGAAAELANLPSGTKVFFAEVSDSAARPFLHGCVEARLSGGGRVELQLMRLSGGIDAGFDAGLDAALVQNLVVSVTDLRNPTVAEPNVSVIVSDGTNTTTGITGSNGQVTLDVSSLSAPFTVTAVGEITVASETFFSAVTIHDLSPVFSGDQATVRIPLELGLAIETGSGQVSGQISNLSAGEVGQVLVRSPFSGSLETGALTGNPTAYAVPTLNEAETYSVLFTVNSTGTLLGINGQLTTSVNGAILNFDANALAPFNLAVDVTSNAGGLNRDSLVTGVSLPLGAFPLSTLANPGVNETVNTPNLNTLVSGWRTFIKLSGSDSNGRSGEATARYTAAQASNAQSLTIPATPILSNPANAANLTESDARALNVAISQLFSGHELVRLRISGNSGNDRYRWTHIAPAGTTSIQLPTLPAPGPQVIVAGVNYEFAATAMESFQAFEYNDDAATNFSIVTESPVLPRSVTQTNSVSVIAD